MYRESSRSDAFGLTEVHELERLTEGLEHLARCLVVGHRDVGLARLHHPIEQRLEVLLLRLREEGRMLRVTTIHEQRRDVLEVLGAASRAAGCYRRRR